MAGSHRRRGGRRHGVLVALAVVALLDVGALAGMGVLEARRAQRVSGAGAIHAPAPQPAEGAGPRVAHVEYGALFSQPGHQVSSDVAWDDEWLFADPTAYNHGLARACAVLSAVANAQSAYYQQGSGSRAYMQEALGALGFRDVDSSSYRYRSEVVDEVSGVVDGSVDVVAYTIATKRVTSRETGAERYVVAVVVRGSYGSEWVSNANLAPAPGESGEDHLGFSRAADEVARAVERRVAQLPAGSEVAYLTCGHSRGGAVANLLAARLPAGPSQPAGSAHPATTYCYTFAAPACTTAERAGASAHDNVFNVVNPSDLVPILPLASWGYRRYGRDVVLPGAGTPGLAALWERFSAAYEASMGLPPTCDPSDREVVASFSARAGRRVPTLEDALTPAGVAQLARSAVGMDVPRLLASHYPNTYIAWLEACGPQDLTFS